jgi:L-alanine-DL-glutamate epimerase-like enolase superfamily enzyme
MLGGKFRDKVRLYADTTETEDPHEQGRRLKKRMESGFTWLKQDFGIDLLKDVPGALAMPQGSSVTGGGLVMHPFTGIEITDKGIAFLSDWVAAIRQEIGMDIPLASDHYGHIGVNSCIRLARAMEKHQLAWMEDMVPWQLPELMKQIKDAVDIPILTGEDIYLKEDFAKLITVGAVDIIHPDLASAGGLLEMKKISDFAMEHGVPMAMHFAGTPVSFMANLHTAVAVENFLVLENHSVDVPWWQDLVSGVPKPILDHGFAAPSDRPGLGVELVEEVVKAHLKPGTQYFAPTPEWDNERSWDRLWS